MSDPLDREIIKVLRPIDPPSPHSDGELYATHEGILKFAGAEFRVYQLNDGQRVFDASDIERFFSHEHSDG